MSFYDDASLIMYPSGYKEDKIYSLKPTDGSGDLTFTRASTATRVNAEGLIETSPVNLILQSNTFSNAVWDNIGSSETSGQAGYDGTANAWSLIENSSTSNHLIRNFPSVYGQVTLSVYAKAGSRNFVYLRGVQSSTNVIAWFNLSTGTVGTVQTNGTAQIESVGNGWYRCSLTVANFQSPFELYVGLSNADNLTTYAGNGTGNIFIQDFQYVLGTTAKPYFPTTDRLNIPRIDYTGGGCGKLLLEPQRTNLVLYSEQLDNAAWTKVTGTTVTANQAVSPDGYQNADLITFSQANTEIRQTISGLTAVTSTASIYLKAPVGQEGGTVLFGYANANQQTVTLTSEWQRVIVTQTNAFNNNVYIGNYSSQTATSVLAWGFQVELNASYPTSYIPTVASSVTRLADAAFKTGISSLIGQTQGTIFFEVNFLNPEPMFLFSMVGTDWLTDSIYFELANSTNYIAVSSVKNSVGVGSATSTIAPTANSRYKIAVQYSGTAFNLYVNGTKITGTRSANALCSKLYLNQLGTLSSTKNNLQTKFKEVVTFTTALSDAECIALTTI